jgi:hypothetical protein
MAYTTINKSSDYFNTVLYSGNGSYGNSITGVGFQPDWVWIKSRNNVYSHQLYDVVRGVDKKLQSDLADAEGTGVNLLHSFDSDGFTVDDDNSINNGSTTYASWNWLADNTSGSSNTDGSITSTISANTTSGFSVVSYAGSNSNVTVGHGLGVAPKMIIFKNRTSSTSWTVYHESLGNTNRLVLNTSGAQESTNQFSFGTSPTSSVLALGGGYNDVNATGQNYIAYCFAEKTGYSKFGSYTGTGSTTETPFIYTGFKPAFVMTKGATIADQWTLSDIPRDNAVGGGNGTGARLTADSNAAESTNTSWASIQKYSNGFSPQGNDNVTNGSSQTYIYMAFAEAPLVGSNNVPATAR